MPLPTDPLFARQWHFSLLTGSLPADISQQGDTTLMQRIWDEYSGAGVHVGVYDTGIEYSHPDLAANYDASRHVVMSSSTARPSTASSSATTAMARPCPASSRPD